MLPVVKPTNAHLLHCGVGRSYSLTTVLAHTIRERRMNPILEKNRHIHFQQHFARSSTTASTFFDPPLLGGTKRFIFPPKLRFRRFFTQNRRYTQVRLLMEARADTSSPCAIWGGYRDTYSKHYGLSRIGTHNESPSATKIDLCEKKDGGWVGSEPNIIS